MANKKKSWAEEVGNDFSDEPIESKSTKSTNTAFILMFPCLILAGMAALYASSIFGSVLAVALGIYQFLMLKKFIEDYYKTR
jgi:uncharacterized membrane protein